MSWPYIALILASLLFAHTRAEKNHCYHECLESISKKHDDKHIAEVFHLSSDNGCHPLYAGPTEIDGSCTQKKRAY